MILLLNFRTGISEMQITRGLALIDVVTGLHEEVLRMKTLPPLEYARLLESLADLEHRLTVGTNEKIQLGSLVGMFWVLRGQLSVKSL
mmetsp:Transcript_80988/g.217290  ORF Transcript_80988/g.217290 Transcript_80988/m.217290 type:complete len:88 (-) Transcript_80988:148-411(-)